MTLLDKCRHLGYIQVSLSRLTFLDKCSGIAWDERAGDTLECLKDEPSDTLALLAVKEDLTNFVDFIHVVVALVHIGRSLSYKLHDYMGRQPTDNTHKNWSLLAP